MDMLFNSANLAPIIPELFLALAVMGFLMLGVFGGNRTTPLISYGAILALVAAGVLVHIDPRALSGFSGMVLTNPFISLVKLMIIAGAVMVLIISSEWLSQEEHGIFEYPVLIMLSVLGMMVMVSAGSLLTIYMGLELMSLPLYVLASIQRDSLRSTEAGLKYFVLGSLASGMMLFGMSLVYGFAGTINLGTLAALFTQMAEAKVVGEPLVISAGLLVGLLLMMVGFAFKVSAVPFHMWTPDVYEGAPTPVTAFSPLRRKSRHWPFLPASCSNLSGICGNIGSKSSFSSPSPVCWSARWARLPRPISNVCSPIAPSVMSAMPLSVLPPVAKTAQARC